MERRSFIQAAAAGTALAAPAIVSAQAQVRWRLASSWPKNLTPSTAAPTPWRAACRRPPVGAFRSPCMARELVPALGVADAVQQGTVECAHTASVFFFGKDPTFALDGQIPFGMTSRQMTGWMYEGGGLKLLRDFYRDYDIVNFACGNTGTQMGGWFRREVKSLAEVKGLKFRIGGFGGVVLQRLGLVPQNLPGGEIYQALERGTIDGAEFVGPYDDEKLGFYKMAKIYHYPSYWDPCGQITMYVNAKAWEALPKDFQQVFELACSDAHVEMQAKYDTRNPDALRRLIGNGVQVKPFPREVGAAAWKASNELYAELSEKNAKWKKIYEQFAKYRDDQILWSRFAEGSFENLMHSMRSSGSRG